MKITNEKTELEKRMERARDGYMTLSETAAPLAFRERSLQRNEVIQRYQFGLDAFAEVRKTREAYELAVENHRRILPGLKQFHGEAMEVARKHFGADAKTMARFEEKCAEPKPRRSEGCRSERGGEVITEVVEEVVEEVVIAKEVVSCEEPAPKRACRPTRRHRPAPKQGCRDAKGCGGHVGKMR